MSGRTMLFFVALARLGRLGNMGGVGGGTVGWALGNGSGPSLSRVFRLISVGVIVQRKSAFMLRSA